MAEMNQWVAPPEQGCNYCHNPENMASDEKYTKVVARRMLQMTRTINSRWSSHVKGTGVTCYTCHRGNAVPENKWALAEGTPDPGHDPRQQARPEHARRQCRLCLAAVRSVRRISDGQAPDPRRGSTALPSPNHVVSIKDAEKTYGLMMHISSALGVNCTYCHNTQSFRAWNLSRAQRGTAYYGIRMVRDINENYISSLQIGVPGQSQGAARRPVQGQLHDLPPGAVEAARRGQHDRPGAVAEGRRPRPPPEGGARGGDAVPDGVQPSRRR